MAAVRRRWTRDELLATLSLYQRLPFGRMHRTNPEVVVLATRIGRTPDAVAYKLGNFAHLDPTLPRTGLSSVSNADRALWSEYESAPEAVSFEAEQALLRLGQPNVIAQVEAEVPPGISGEERMSLVRTRVNQERFRRTVLARYAGTCCISGLDVETLLVAAHIVRWADVPEERMNPRNGLCLNALHDRAFEVGAITIDDGLRVRVRSDLRERRTPSVERLLLAYHGQPLILAGDIEPDRRFLRRHRAMFGA